MSRAAPISVIKYLPRNDNKNTGELLKYLPRGRTSFYKLFKSAEEMFYRFKISFRLWFIYLLSILFRD